MKKKIVLIAVVVPLVAAIVGLVIVTQQKINAKETLKEKMATLPNFTFLTTDSVAFTSNRLVTKPTIVIHFHSECDYCQYEAEEITENAAKFQAAQVVFISEQPLTKVKTFAEKYALDKHSFITVLKAPEDGFYNTFGSSSVPNIFIYGADRQLRKHFKGETKVEALLGYLE